MDTPETGDRKFSNAQRWLRLGKNSVKIRNFIPPLQG
jgi:hypothetical protein